MMTPIVSTLAGGLAFMVLLQMQAGAAAQSGAPKTWSNVMYLGGAAGVRGKSLNWSNKLTLSPDTLGFEGTGKEPIRFEIPVVSIRSLEYSGHRHFNDGAASTGVLVGGLAGLLAGTRVKSTDHYVIVDYLLADGTPSAILLRLHKDNQGEILGALQALIKPADAAK
jgi:hypothetical protein